MALQFNSFLKTGPGGIPGIVANSGWISDNAVLFYPSTVPMPTTVPLTGATMPAGWILRYDMGGQSGFTATGNTVGFTATEVANALAAGTITWGALVGSIIQAGKILITDSVVVSGGNGIFGLTTLTPTNGQAITCTMTLQYI